MVVVLVVAAGAAWESPVLELVAGRPGSSCSSAASTSTTCSPPGSAGQADAALVALDAPGLDRAAVDLLHRQQVRVVAVAGGGSPDAARARSARVGVDALADEGDLARVLDLLESDDEPVASVVLPEVDVPTARGIGAGVRRVGTGRRAGSDAVATSLAAILLRRGLRTTLVDADPYGGAVGSAPRRARRGLRAARRRPD